jgi:hypothetical protein
MPALPAQHVSGKSLPLCKDPRPAQRRPCRWPRGRPAARSWSCRWRRRGPAARSCSCRWPRGIGICAACLTHRVTGSHGKQPDAAQAGHEYEEEQVRQVGPGSRQSNRCYEQQHACFEMFQRKDPHGRDERNQPVSTGSTAVRTGTLAGSAPASTGTEHSTARPAATAAHRA